MEYGDVVHREFSIYDSDDSGSMYEDNVPHHVHPKKVEHTPSPIQPSPPDDKEKQLYVK